MHGGGPRDGAVQVVSIKPRIESAPGVCNQRLKLKCDEPLSDFAFSFNLRHYSEAAAKELNVGRCRLTVSNLELKERLVSALETKI